MTNQTLSLELKLRCRSLRERMSGASWKHHWSQTMLDHAKGKQVIRGKEQKEREEGGKGRDREMTD